MTTKPLPNSWLWDDTAGRSHMVAEGATLEGGHGQKPTLHSLCGETVPVGVHRIGLHINQCDGCYERLTELIGEALDLRA
jgi:hypothetical protein